MAITMYSTPTCTYCRKAKDWFRENHIKFTEYDISRDQRRADEMMRKSGQMGVPVITIDDKVVIGFNQSQLDSLLS